MTAPLGEGLRPLDHVVVQGGLDGPPPTPARRFCPATTRPTWLPPRQFHCQLDHHTQRTYGITCDDYWHLFERQDGRCAVCRHPPGQGRRLVVDHDHDTGLIDGLCHFGCNRRLSTAIRRYLTDPPGRHLDLAVAPAKLKTIQERDDAKRKRAAERAAERRARRAATPPTDSFSQQVDRALQETRR